MSKAHATLILKKGTPLGIGDTTVGTIFHDTATHGNHPFPDGTVVNTSRIQRVVMDEEGMTVETRNTLYYVEYDS